MLPPMARLPRIFNAQAFLDSEGLSKTIVEYKRDDVVFAQGDRCESVMTEDDVLAVEGGSGAGGI